MKRVIKPLIVAAIAVGCVVDNPGSVLRVEKALIVQTGQCTFDAQAVNIMTQGRRDVRSNSLGNFGYVIGIVVANLSQSVEDRPLAFGNQQNVYIDNTDITVDGFNVCYEFPAQSSRNTTESGAPLPENTFPSCKSIRERSRSYFLPSAAVIRANREVTAMSLDLFPPAVSLASVQTPFNMSSSPFEQNLSVDGDRKTVIVHMQATGHMNDNSYVESNEFLFPVDLCVGCVPFSTGNCTTGKVPDPNTFCFPGQDTVPDCVTPN